MNFRLFVIVLSLAVLLMAIVLSLTYDFLIDNLIDYNKDIDRNTMEIIEMSGFKGEDHYVVTEDGYILLMTRIVNPFVKDRTKLRPILLQHCWMCNANIWIMNSKARLQDNGLYVEENMSGSVGNNLGFVLAVNGYDVWLPNKRGTPRSLNHTRLKSQDPEFWRFSIDETVEYDLPAIISHIQKVTEKEQLAYIGYSQGTMEMFMLLSSRPEYSNILKPIIAVTPIFYLDHAIQISPLFKFVNYLSWYLKTAEAPFFALGKFGKIMAKVCETKTLVQTLCFKFFQVIAGLQDGQYNMTRSGVYAANLLVGTSSWNSVHLLQEPKLGRVKKYDYGDPEKNSLKYGSTIPPDYDLSAINSTNIALIYAANDWKSNLKDIERLKNDLKVSFLDDYLIPVPSWNHLEVLLAIDTGKYVNTRILQILSNSL